MKHWWCMGCQAEVKLSKHGRCEVCDSEAVDLLPSEADSTPMVGTRSCAEISDYECDLNT